MLRCLFVSTIALLAAAGASAQEFEKVVTKVNAKFDSASVKRGEAVTWTLSLEIAKGWHTYPTKQSDPMADSYVNRIKFPRENGVIFVGELEEPVTIEKTIDGTKIAMVEDKGTWKRTVVISPDAKPGKIKVQVPVTILACADSCLPPKKILVEAELTISDAAAVPVDPKYAKELDAPK